MQDWLDDEFVEYDPKHIFETATAETFAALEAVRRYQQIRDNLQGIGLFFILAVLANWIGVICCRPDSDSAWLTMVLFPALAGIGLLVAPSRITILAASIPLVLLSVYKIWLFGTASVNRNHLDLILPLLLFWGAYGCFKGFRHLTEKPIIEPDPTLLIFYKIVGQILRHLSPYMDADIIDFKIKHQRWRGWLLDEYAVFAWRRNWEKLFFVQKSNVGFAPNNSGLIAKNPVKGTFKIDDRVSWGEMQVDSLARFEHWKLRDMLDTDYVVQYDQKRHTRRFLSVIRWIAGIGIALIILAIIIWAIWLYVTYA